MTLRDPRVSKSVPKGTKIERKRVNGTQSKPKWNQKGCQNASKNYPKTDVWKRLRKKVPTHAVSYGNFLVKTIPRSMQKSMSQKVCKWIGIDLQNDAKTKSKSNGKSKKFWNLRFLDFCEEYNVKIAFSHDQGSQNTIANRSNIDANGMFEKGMLKSCERL